MDPKKLQMLLNAMRQNAAITDNQPMQAPQAPTQPTMPTSDEVMIPQQFQRPLDQVPDSKFDAPAGQVGLPGDRDVELRKRALQMMLKKGQ